MESNLRINLINKTASDCGFFMARNLHTAWLVQNLSKDHVHAWVTKSVYNT
jgi:hypothetical protein